MTTQLKNATSTSTRTFEAIQKTLASHKAKQIIFDYGDDGRIYAISFSIEINDNLCPFRLPARVKNVEKIMYPNGYLTANQKEQAYRTAWANIRDWISSQMAMVDTGMVKPEEVLLPYLLNPAGQTFFEAMEERQFLLPSPMED